MASAAAESPELQVAAGGQRLGGGVRGRSAATARAGSPAGWPSGEQQAGELPPGGVRHLALPAVAARLLGQDAIGGGSARPGPAPAARPDHAGTATRCRRCRPAASRPPGRGGRSRAGNGRDSRWAGRRESKPMAGGEGCPALGVLEQGEELGVFVGGAQDQARVEVRRRPRVQRPDEVAAVVVGGEDAPGARRGGDQARRFGGHPERDRLGERRLAREREQQQARQGPARRGPDDAGGPAAGPGGPAGAGASASRLAATAPARRWPPRSGWRSRTAAAGCGWR